MNQRDYRSPFVLVQFSNPAYNVAINVKCDAHANNLTPNGMTKTGTVQFQIMVTPQTQ